MLITCMLFCVIVAIALTSYLRLARNSYTMADRAFLNTTALTFAEQGLGRHFPIKDALDGLPSGEIDAKEMAVPVTRAIGGHPRGPDYSAAHGVGSPGTELEFAL